MARRRPAVADPVEAAEPVTDDRGDLLVYLEADEPELCLDPEPRSLRRECRRKRSRRLPNPCQASEPEVVEPRSRNRLQSRPGTEPEPSRAVQEAEPEAVEPVQEAEPADPVGLDPDEPEYAPVAPLFEAEPFVRKQRAAFGRRRAG
jgi:hypothetical protein